MNRFVKDNLILVISIALTCLVAVGLLVYGIIEWVRISELMDETDSLRNKIVTLNKAKPAPVDGNKQPIKDDTQEYVKLFHKLTPVFDSPLRQSKDAFLRALYNLKADEITDEAARKFLDLYNERVMSASNPTAQRMQWDKLRGEFKNWETAANAFREAAVKAGVEKEQLDYYINDIVLAELGIPRRMNEDANELQRFLNNTRTYLTERLGERLAGGDTFGIIPPSNGFAKSDYPIIARHTAILSDIIIRIAESKIDTFNGIFIRGTTGENWNSSFSEENGCRIAHYTFEVNGTLDSIRNLAASFDNALKDNRFYIVRSVFLYGTEAEKIRALLRPEMKNNEGEMNPQQQQSDSGSGLFGGGRRARLARARQQEEQQREEEKKKQRDASADALREREKNLQIHERHGYGEIKLGDVSSFKAIFDIDYIERI